MSPLSVFVVLVGALVFCALLLGVARISWSRRRKFSEGLRGTAAVVDVRPVPRVRGGWVQTKNTDIVTVATAARDARPPRTGTPPSGQYRVGQIVPVVQEPGRPDMLYLDRPDLVPPLSTVLRPLAFLLIVPVIVILGLTR